MNQQHRPSPSIEEPTNSTRRNVFDEPDPFAAAADEDAGSLQTWLLILTGLLAAIFMAGVIRESLEPATFSWAALFSRSVLAIALTAVAGVVWHLRPVVPP